MTCQKSERPNAETDRQNDIVGQEEQNFVTRLSNFMQLLDI